MNKQIIQARIDTLRKTLVAQDLTAIIVPSADPHLSEYLPAIRIYRFSRHFGCDG